MSDNKSIAFWCERSTSDAKVRTEFHVNLWHFSGAKRRDFIEIGVMPSDPSALSAIRIFVPFPLRRENIEDLGPEFATSIFSHLKTAQSTPANSTSRRKTEAR